MNNNLYGDEQLGKRARKPSTNQIVLIIKAETFVQAKRAANTRGIHVSDLCALEYNSFRARTDKRNSAAVLKWFDEPRGPAPKGFGYPIGTLMFFRLD